MREHAAGSAAGTDTADRIAAALTAYACGDALGLPWENRPLRGAGPAEIEALPRREGWERGATSDDTALTLLIARHLAERDGAADALAFLATLAAEADTIHGLGPSTRRAIEHVRATGGLPSRGTPPPRSGPSCPGIPRCGCPARPWSPGSPPRWRRCSGPEPADRWGW